MNFGCCGEKRVHDASGPPGGLAACHNLSPNVGDSAVNRQDSSLEAQR